jgi:hypothetical protein
MRQAVALLVLAGHILTSSPAGGGHRLILGTVGQTRHEIQEREREAGHRLAGVRVFRRWGEPLFDGDQRWARRTGHVVFLSIKSRRKNGALISWRDIASARPGSALQAGIARQAREIARFGAIVYVVFNHEPDARTSRPMGTPAEFVAAWRHIVDTYRAAGVRNARYVWTLTGPAFGEGAGHGLTRADTYYPGDAYVDDIAGDTYNWNTCHSRSGRWQSPAEVLEPQRRFGLRHPRKGLMLLEWGTVEDPARPGRKAQWIRDMTRLLGQPGYRQFRAALHWDDRFSGVMAGTGCDFDNRTSATALSAWRGMTTTPLFAARSSCDIGDCPAPPRRSLLPIVAGVACAAIVVTGLVTVGVRRRRLTRTGRRPTPGRG